MSESHEYNPRAEVDEASMGMLTSMGFTEQHCVRALITTRYLHASFKLGRESLICMHACSGNVEQAMDYLLQHTGDPVLDAPLTPPPKAIKSKRGGAFQPDPAVGLLIRC